MKSRWNLENFDLKLNKIANLKLISELPGSSSAEGFLRDSQFSASEVQNTGSVQSWGPLQRRLNFWKFGRPGLQTLDGFSSRLVIKNPTESFESTNFKSSYCWGCTTDTALTERCFVVALLDAIQWILVWFEKHILVLLLKSLCVSSLSFSLVATIVKNPVLIRISIDQGLRRLKSVFSAWTAPHQALRVSLSQPTQQVNGIDSILLTERP